jgi:CHC2 zinc finger/Toprim-like
MSVGVSGTYSGSSRIDWDGIRDRVDLAAVATALLGSAEKQSGRRLYWRYPFHDDHSPSFQVDTAMHRWRCWPCGLGGDAPALVMKLDGVGFPEAVRTVAELAGVVVLSGPPIRSGPAPPSVRVAAGTPGKAAARSPERPSGLERPEAERLTAQASERLWTPEGTKALAYLRDRGMTDATIKGARLGWYDKIRLPLRDQEGTWLLTNFVAIPWFDPSGRLERINTRRLGLFNGSKYIQAFSDSPIVYPSMSAIRCGAPLVIAEGEFDAILLAQELAGLASVITTGSKSNLPKVSLRVAMLGCSRLYAAHDDDGSGDDAAARWPGRAVRVRPPAGKDWTEALQAGVDLRRWWIAEHFPFEFDREERAAIVEYDGGLSREEAERRVGLWIGERGIAF